MEFMLMFTLYVVASILIIISFLVGDGSRLHEGRVGKCVSFVGRAVSLLGYLVPRPLLRQCWRVFDYIFYTRNSFFKLLYIGLWLGGHIILVVDCLPYLYSYQSDVNHVSSALYCAFFNLVFFLMSSYSDPGVITHKNLKTHRYFYKKEDYLYKGGGECPTCVQPKPARSKHCAYSNKCYYKFDHFCVWTNNCVAALNHRWFLLFLASIVVMCVNATHLMVSALRLIASAHNLMDLRYLDEHGQAQAMNYRVLLQTLFMSFPRLVFLAVALPTVAILLFGFLTYHLYLVFTNQTTNERYKLRKLQKESGKRAPCRYPYSKGLIRNIMEEIFPLNRSKSQ